MRVILASKSPRRIELLRIMGFSDFTVHPAPEEENTPPGLSPGEAVQHIALQKARTVAGSFGGEDLIIAADTLVYLEGEALGKPADAADAARMLRRLSGNQHTVYTGVALLRGAEIRAAWEATDVFFCTLGEEEITAYVTSGEPMDKAGSYAIQGKGARFVRRIEGDFYNVVGLPVSRLYAMLKDLGIDV